MQHTPGPWMIDDDNDVLTDDGRTLAIIYENDEANARLISAAPEIYAALGAMIAEFKDYHYHGCPGDSPKSDCECDCFAGALLTRAKAAYEKAQSSR